MAATMQRFQVITPEGWVAPDTFVLADEQPPAIKPDCALIVHEASGRPLTVHRSRLVALEDRTVQTPDQQRNSVCFKCGKVEGVVEDQVACPRDGQTDCGLIEATT